MRRGHSVAMAGMHVLCRWGCGAVGRGMDGGGVRWGDAGAFCLDADHSLLPCSHACRRARRRSRCATT